MLSIMLEGEVRTASCCCLLCSLHRWTEEMEKRLLEYVLKLFTACEFWFIQVASYPR